MGRTLCASDIHGSWKVWEAIKNELKPDDTLYILGDCADRGKRGWDIIKEAINHPQVIYLKGNHEEMLADAILEARESDMFGRAYYLLASNGGSITYSGWVDDGCYTEWANKLKSLPCFKIYKNKQGQVIYLSHAGFTPYWGEDKVDEDNLLWSRDHFLDGWPEDQYLANSFIIHGHTPIPYLVEDLGIIREAPMGQPYWYCNGHKCCIDNLTAFTKEAILLDLDTFDHILVK